MPTTVNTILWAEISQYLAANAVQKGGLYGGGINPQLSRILYIERKSVAWKYAYDPTATDLVGTRNYLYWLCGSFNLLAKAIADGGGGGTPVVPVTPSECTGMILITAADFSSDGVTVVRTDWVNKTLFISWDNISKWIFEPTDWVYIIGGGFRIIIPGFDANEQNADCKFVVFIGCFNPGAVQYAPAFGSSFQRATFSGDGVITEFSIPHLIGSVPNFVIQPVGDDSSGEYSVTADDTNIIITYNVAPPDGTDNVIFDWSANSQ